MKSSESTTLDIVSLNIEWDRHFDRIIPFLKKRNPDVVLLQEVVNKDLAMLEDTLKMESAFTVLCHWPRDTKELELGIATFSKFPIIKNHSEYYKGDRNDPLWLEPRGPEKIPRAILAIEIHKEGKPFHLVNTHFTWTPDGKPSAQQHIDLENLFLSLNNIPEFILCGDFNAPRGTAIFDKLASKYKDNIPLEVTTTIDKNWHKAGDLRLVVDGLFTTAEYQVETVEVLDNLSDHCAIAAKIRKNTRTMITSD